MTHTFATLLVSTEAYDEIASKLRAAHYDHAFVDGRIDMRGLALVRGATSLHRQEFEKLKAAFEARVTELLTANNAEWLKRIDAAAQVHDLERRLEMAEHALETVLGLANDRSDPGKDTRQAVIEVAEDALAERRQQLCVDHLASLVSRFALALLKKLRAVEQKCGFRNAWAIPTWHGELVQNLFDCVYKGDPIDVAAYAAFAWHHGWTTTPAPVHVQMVGRARRPSIAEQLQVEAFVSTRFGKEVLLDLGERVDRVFEEAAELAQAEGRTSDHLARILAYVFSRDVGAPAQEAAGVAVTLLAYGAAKGISIRKVEAEEIDRIMSKPAEHFRQRQAAKAMLGVALAPTVGV